MLNNDRKILSIACEANDKHGDSEIFCVGIHVSLYNEHQIDRILYRCPIRQDMDYVTYNILDNMEDIELTHASYMMMLFDLATFYKIYQDNADVIVYNGYPIITRLLDDMIRSSSVRDLKYPSPLIELSSSLRQMHENVDDINFYANKYDIMPSCASSSRYNPLYNALIQRVVYCHLEKRKKNLFG